MAWRVVVLSSALRFQSLSSAEAYGRAVGLGSVGRVSGAEWTAFGGIEEPGAGARWIWTWALFHAAVD